MATITNDSIKSAARQRHRLMRVWKLTSWFPVTSTRVVVAITTMNTSGEVTIDQIVEGRPNMVIGQWLAGTQNEIDRALAVEEGEAWNDVWHAGNFLSAMLNLAAGPLLQCRASAFIAAELRVAFEASMLRVRSRIAASATEAPRLTAHVLQICSIAQSRAA